MRLKRFQQRLAHLPTPSLQPVQEYAGFHSYKSARVNSLLESFWWCKIQPFLHRRGGRLPEKVCPQQRFGFTFLLERNPKPWHHLIFDLWGPFSSSQCWLSLVEAALGHSLCVYVQLIYWTCKLVENENFV